MLEMQLEDGTLVDAEMAANGQLKLTVWVSDTRAFAGVTLDVKS